MYPGSLPKELERIPRRAVVFRERYSAHVDNSMINGVCRRGEMVLHATLLLPPRRAGIVETGLRGQIRPVGAAVRRCPYPHHFSCKGVCDRRVHSVGVRRVYRHRDPADESVGSPPLSFGQPLPLVVERHTPEPLKPAYQVLGAPGLDTRSVTSPDMLRSSFARRLWSAKSPSDNGLVDAIVSGSHEDRPLAPGRTATLLTWQVSNLVLPNLLQVWPPSCERKTPAPKYEPQHAFASPVPT